MLTCHSLQETRNKYIHHQLPTNSNTDDLIQIILLVNGDLDCDEEYFIYRINYGEKGKV